MRDQLPRKPNNVETGIINLDNSDAPGTHWVAYAIDRCGIVYFDSYGLAPPKEFYKYTSGLKNPKGFSIPIWHSTLPTQQLNDPPICGREVLNVLDEISKSKKSPHVVVNDYSSGNFLKRSVKV